MSLRDRMALTAVILVVALIGAWMVVVSPERSKATALAAQVATARAALSTSEGELQNARKATAKYSAAYASLVSLGKAVPVQSEVPSLIVQLSQASGQHSVDFNSITFTPPSTSGSLASTAAAATAASSAAPSSLPFNFIFTGGFFQLERLFAQMSALTTRSPQGALLVNGRLLTIQSIKLAQAAEGGSETSKAKKASLTGTITATAYTMAAPQAPAGAPASSGAATTSTASTSGAASSATTPALIKVTP